jgi:hypothetical protein
MLSKTVPSPAKSACALMQPPPLFASSFFATMLCCSVFPPLSDLRIPCASSDHGTVSSFPLSTSTLPILPRNHDRAVHLLFVSPSLPAAPSLSSSHLLAPSLFSPPLSSSLLLSPPLLLSSSPPLLLSSSPPLAFWPSLSSSLLLSFSPFSSPLLLSPPLSSSPSSRFLPVLSLPTEHAKWALPSQHAPLYHILSPPPPRDPEMRPEREWRFIFLVPEEYLSSFLPIACSYSDSSAPTPPIALLLLQ